MKTTEGPTIHVMEVGEITGDPVLAVTPDTPLVSVAAVLDSAHVGAVIVRSNHRVQGVVSERDLVKAMADRRDLETTTAAEVASTELVWAESTAPVVDVAQEMMEHWVRHVLVERKGRLVGIVSARDLLGVLADGRS